MKYAVVEFLSTKDEDYSQGYTYTNTIKAKKYDAVLVPTKYGLSLAVVVQLTDEHNLNSYGCIKELSEVIESKAIGKIMADRKRKDIKKKLEAEVKKLDDVARFEMYANASPEFSKLLEEYKSLNK